MGARLLGTLLFLFLFLLPGCIGPGSTDIIVENLTGVDTEVHVFVGWPDDVVYNGTIQVGSDAPATVADAFEPPRDHEADRVPFEVTSGDRPRVRGSIDLFNTDTFTVQVHPGLLEVRVAPGGTESWRP